MVVKVLDFSSEEDVEKWDNFVIKFGRLYHHSRWAEILSSVYTFRPFYLYVENDCEIVSVFPLFYVKLSFIRDELVSIPHLEAGGILNTEYHPLYFDYIYRNITPQRIKIYQFKEPIGDFVANRNEVIMVLELPEKKEEIISGIRSERMRTYIRRALEENYDFIIGNGKDVISQFYDLYLKKMREFGTPPHGIQFMEKIADTYGENCKILLVKDSNEFLGAGLYVLFGEFLYNFYLTVPGEHLRQKAGYFLGYKAKEFALSQGARYLVLGRCAKGSGGYLYKSKLNGKPVQLYLYNFVRTTSGYKALEEKTVKQKYDNIAGLWGKLPSFFTDKAGPLIRRWVY